MLKGLKNLLFGGGNSGGGDPNGDYHYIRVYQKPGRPTENDEIVQIRLDLRNDLSPDIENPNVYFSRKAITGPKTFARTEAHFFYDKDRKLVDAEVENGEVVGEEDYDAYLANFQDKDEELA